MNIKPLFIAGLILLVHQSLTLAEKDSTLYHLHHFFSDDRYTYQRSGSGLGFITSIIISIFAGVLCFLGIMYFFKYRRDGFVTIPCLGTFGNRNPHPDPYPQQHPVNAAYHTRPAYAQDQPIYGGNPYVSNNHHEQGFQPYNANNPQYPQL